MSATLQSNIISATKLHIKLFQCACKTDEVIDTPKGKAWMWKALIKSCKTFKKNFLFPKYKTKEGNNYNIKTGRSKEHFFCCFFIPSYGVQETWTITHQSFRTTFRTAKGFLFSPLTTLISLSHRSITCKNLQLSSCLRRLLAQELEGHFNRAINQLRRGKGMKPGSPVMSKVMLCQNLR